MPLRNILAKRNMTHYNSFVSIKEEDKPIAKSVLSKVNLLDKSAHGSVASARVKVLSFSVD